MKKSRERTQMKQPQGKIRSGALLLTLPLEEPKPSKSGKTEVIASTHGFRRIGVRLNGGQEVYVTANACVYIPRRPSAE
jgi:hypothetical protein